MPELPPHHPRVYALALALWNYHVLGEPLIGPYDCILTLGGNDLRTPRYSAKLFREYTPSWMIMTGGIAHQGDLLETRWSRSEAEEYAAAAIASGVPTDQILLEPNSTNTGENLLFARRLLEKNGLPFERLLIVTKPPMERRAKATAEVVFPDCQLGVTSPPLGFREYIDHDAAHPEPVIHIMVGDYLRFQPYAEKGYQTRQYVPAEVRQAVEELLRLGYDHHLPPAQ